MPMRPSPSHLRGGSGVIERGVARRAMDQHAAVEVHTVRIDIPGPLRSYTRQTSRVTVALPAPNPTLGGALTALDRDHPGIRFRIIDEQNRLRPHIQIFVNAAIERDLAAQLPTGAQIMIVAALSGG